MPLDIESKVHKGWFGIKHLLYDELGSKSSILSTITISIKYIKTETKTFSLNKLYLSGTH